MKKITVGRTLTASLSGSIKRSSLRSLKYVALLPILLMGISSVSQDTYSQKPSAVAPAVPKTWDDEAVATLEVPLANPLGSPKHVSADYYYRIPVPPI